MFWSTDLSCFRSWSTDCRSKSMWFKMSSFSVHPGTKKHLCLWPPLCLLRAHSPGCYTVCINVCRSTEKTERLWGFHHRFVRLADSICFVCCRFPRLIRVGTMRFIHNEQTFVFSLPACCRWARFCWPEASARSHRRWRRFILELSRCSASDVDLVAVGFFVGDLRFVLFWFLLASACLCWGECFHQRTSSAARIIGWINKLKAHRCGFSSQCSW